MLVSKTLPTETETCARRTEHIVSRQVCQLCTKSRARWIGAAQKFVGTDFPASGPPRREKRVACHDTTIGIHDLEPPGTPVTVGGALVPVLWVKLDGALQTEWVLAVQRRRRSF